MSITPHRFISRLNATKGLCLCAVLVVAISSAFSQDAKKPGKITDTERQELVDGLAKLQHEVAAAE
ncbi:MAG: hypothetical protein RL693_2864, partial [Verrucomicrobiota bacterium]